MTAPTVAAPSYADALKAGRKAGAGRADEPGLLALFCAGPLQTLFGAVAPRLVYDGAIRAGLTTAQVAALTPQQVDDLQWT